MYGNFLFWLCSLGHIGLESATNLPLCRSAIISLAESYTERPILTEKGEKIYIIHWMAVNGRTFFFHGPRIRISRLLNILKKKKVKIRNVLFIEWMGMERQNTWRAIFCYSTYTALSIGPCFRITFSEDIQSIDVIVDGFFSLKLSFFLSFFLFLKMFVFVCPLWHC